MPSHGLTWPGPGSALARLGLAARTRLAPALRARLTTCRSPQSSHARAQALAPSQTLPSSPSHQRSHMSRTCMPKPRFRSTQPALPADQVQYLISGQHSQHSWQARFNTLHPTRGPAHCGTSAAARTITACSHAPRICVRRHSNACSFSLSNASTRPTSTRCAAVAPQTPPFLPWSSKVSYVQDPHAGPSLQVSKTGTIGRPGSVLSISPPPLSSH